MDPRDRALVTELFYGVLRWRLRLDAVIARYARTGVPKDPELANILRMGVYQLLFLDRIPARAAVHSAVKLTRKVRGDKVSRFVNGVLRTVDRERPEPVDLAEAWSHPQWMVDLFRQEVGDDALASRLEANMQSPPMSLRLHPSETGPAPTDSDAIRRGIRAGKWLPQDEASQRVVRLLDPQPGDRVLELCAGRGVKSSQLAEAVQAAGRLVCLDASPGRLGEASRLLQRWAPDVPVSLLAADCARPLPIDPTQRFDRVLIDAPCSGLGVIRRRPETLWRRKPDDIAELAELQRRILTEALRWVHPGGVVVYAVCTTTPQETVDIVAPHTIADSFVTRPERDGVDGFYCARLAL